MQHNKIRTTSGNASWCNRRLTFIGTDRPEALALLCGQESGERWMYPAGELVGNYSYRTFLAGATRKPNL